MKFQQYREQIDDIDKQLIHLLAKRNHVVREFAIYKRHQQIPVFDMKRWKEMLRTRAEMANDLNMYLPAFKRIYLYILRMGLEVEREAY